MLNIVLVVVLVSEVIFEMGLTKLSGDFDYSANVHKGVNALIFSIILAVAVILFFFQGRLNFIKENKWLKSLALIWVAQNVLLVVLTACKNWLYVEQFFLTYKRIGVFVYLICCLIGLIYTYLKIVDAKSNWFLVRRVGWTIYGTLLITPIINWDYMIIEYNFSHASSNPENLDVEYLLDLPEANYPLVFKRLEEFKDHFPDEWSERDHMLGSFYSDASEYDWRSFNFRTFNALTNKKHEDEISYEY